MVCSYYYTYRELAKETIYERQESNASATINIKKRDEIE
jgi:hypothetical protein